MSEIIPMNGEEPETQNLENLKVQNLNERIRGFSETETPQDLVSTFPEIQETLEETAERLRPEVLYTIDDLIDVWSRGMTNGATLWQYCQDHEYKLPSSFEAGSLELVNEVRNSKDKSQALQAMINNNMLLLGVFTEKQ